MTLNTDDSNVVTMANDDRLRVSTYEATSSVLSGGYVRKASYEYMNDGSPKKASNLLDSGFDQNYAFDSIGRLSTSASGTKMNGLNQTVTPYAQSIGYNAFGDITSRSTDVWGGDGGFTASYTNGHKTGGTEIYDAAGNVVDKTTTFTTYNRWKFDASGRNVEGTLRWYQTNPTPQLDRTETVTNTFDGDGLNTKRVDSTVITQYPANTTSTVEKIEYYVRSSVLGGQMLTEIDENGAKKQTNVILGKGIVAEQRNYPVTSTGEVFWRHDDPFTGSYTKIDRFGNAGNEHDPPAKIEFEPLGGAIPIDDPNSDPTLAVPSSVRSFKYSGDVNRSEVVCIVDGIMQADSGACGEAVGKGIAVPFKMEIPPGWGYWEDNALPGEEDKLIQSGVRTRFVPGLGLLPRGDPPALGGDENCFLNMINADGKRATRIARDYDALGHNGRHAVSPITVKDTAKNGSGGDVVDLPVMEGGRVVRWGIGEAKTDVNPGSVYVDIMLSNGFVVRILDMVTISSTIRNNLAVGKENMKSNVLVPSAIGTASQNSGTVGGSESGMGIHVTLIRPGKYKLFLDEHKKSYNADEKKLGMYLLDPLSENSPIACPDYKDQIYVKKGS